MPIVRIERLNVRVTAAKESLKKHCPRTRFNRVERQQAFEKRLKKAFTTSSKTALGVTSQTRRFGPVGQGFVSLSENFHKEAANRMTIGVKPISLVNPNQMLKQF